jgi:hypothetical protein
VAWFDHGRFDSALAGLTAIVSLLVEAARGVA